MSFPHKHSHDGLNTLLRKQRVKRGGPLAKPIEFIRSNMPIKRRRSRDDADWANSEEERAFCAPGPEEYTWNGTRAEETQELVRIAKKENGREEQAGAGAGVGINRSEHAQVEEGICCGLQRQAGWERGVRKATKDVVVENKAGFNSPGAWFVNPLCGPPFQKTQHNRGEGLVDHEDRLGSTNTKGVCHTFCTSPNPARGSQRDLEEALSGITLTPEQERVFFSKARKQVLKWQGTNDEILKKLDAHFETCQSAVAGRWRELKGKCAGSRGTRLRGSMEDWMGVVGLLDCNRFRLGC